MMATCKDYQLQLRLKQGMREVYGQGDNQLQGRRHLRPQSYVSFASYQFIKTVSSDRNNQPDGTSP